MNNGTRNTVIGALVVVALGFLFWAKVPLQDHKLYRYYPQSTGFFLELAAGDQLTQRFLNNIDQQNAMNEARSLQINADPKLRQAALKRTEEQRKFRRGFLEKFNSTFDPYFSIGSWQPEQPASPELASKKGEAVTSDSEAAPSARQEPEALIIFPLKKGQRDNQTLPQLLQQFGHNVSDYDNKTYPVASKKDEPVQYLLHRDSKAAIAILDGNFLVANSEQAMITALRHVVEKTSSVLDEPLNKRYVAKLAKKRDGIMLLNNQVASDAAESLQSGIPNGEMMTGTAMKKIMAVMPVVVAAIDLRRDNQLGIRLVSPIMLSSMEDPVFKSDLQRLYERPVSLDSAKSLPQATTMYLSVAGLDRWFDFYANHFATPQQVVGAQMMQAQLKGAGLDFRQDVVGLLAERAVLAADPAHQSVLLLLKTSSQKEAALQRINAALSKMLPPQAFSSEQVENVSLNTLMLPSRVRPLKIGYGKVNGSILVAPMNNATQAVQVSKGRAANLDRAPLYRNLTHSMPNKASVMLYWDMREMAAKMAAVGRPQPPFQTVALSLWVTPEEAGKIDLLQGQINLELPPEIQRVVTVPNGKSAHPGQVLPHKRQPAR